MKYYMCTRDFWMSSCYWIVGSSYCTGIAHVSKLCNNGQEVNQLDRK